MISSVARPARCNRRRRHLLGPIWLSALFSPTGRAYIPVMTSTSQRDEAALRDVGVLATRQPQTAGPRYHVYLHFLVFLLQLVATTHPGLLFLSCPQNHNSYPSQQSVRSCCHKSAWQIVRCYNTSEALSNSYEMDREVYQSISLSTRFGGAGRLLPLSRRGSNFRSRPSQANAMAINRGL